MYDTAGTSHYCWGRHSKILWVSGRSSFLEVDLFRERVISPVRSLSFAQKLTTSIRLRERTISFSRRSGFVPDAPPQQYCIVHTCSRPEPKTSYRSLIIASLLPLGRPFCATLPYYHAESICDRRHV